MADVIITNPFVSTKPDSPDSSIVSSSEWNAAQFVSGGLQGQLFARNAGSLTGASYVDGAKINFANATYSGATPSPELCSITLTFNSTVFLMVIAALSAVTSGAANVVVAVKRDGATVDQFTIGGTGLATSYPFVIGESPGTHIYTISIAAVSGTFTSAGVRLLTFSVGAV
jgi:hypothetical protein